MYVEYPDSVAKGEKHIPKHRNNKEYRKFLKWVAEGNTPASPPPGEVPKTPGEIADHIVGTQPPPVINNIRNLLCTQGQATAKRK